MKAIKGLIEITEQNERILTSPCPYCGDKLVTHGPVGICYTCGYETTG